MPRFFESIMWIAFYGAFLIFALTASSAPAMYHAIFISRTAADWLPSGSPRYDLLTPIRGNQLSPNFASGWWRAEAEFRWGRGARSTIVIQPTSDLPKGSRARGRIAAMLGGDRSDQEIKIEIDGVEVADLQFGPSTGIADFDVPLPSPIHVGEQMEIAFIVPGATSPFLLHTSDDDRQLGVRFYELELAPPR